MDQANMAGSMGDGGIDSGGGGQTADFDLGGHGYCHNRIILSSSPRT
jgi:hypothetical protein